MALAGTDRPGLIGCLAPLLVVVLAGCLTAPMPDLSDLPNRPVGFPEPEFLEQGGEPARIDESQSWIEIRAYREGRLARLGHNHIISAPLYGIVRTHADQLQVRAWVPVAELVVDDPDRRAGAGEAFSSVPTADDIDGTRANMLSEKALDASAHPFLLGTLSMEGCTPSGQLAIRGIWRDVDLNWERRDDRSGWLSFELNQTDFGMQPFSVLGGALRVGDQLTVRSLVVLDRHPSSWDGCDG